MGILWVMDGGLNSSLVGWSTNMSFETDKLIFIFQFVDFTNSYFA